MSGPGQQCISESWQLADLPRELLLEVFAHLLARAERSWDTACEPMGAASSVLRFAVQLAAVCRSWREAAVLAVKAQPELELQPSATLPAQYLSPLLAELAAGRQEIALRQPLLAAPEAAVFLTDASPKLLRALGPHSASAAMGSMLAECEGLCDLLCDGGLVPTELPPDLQFLVVCLESGSNSQHLSAVLQSVSDLDELGELKLYLAEVVLPDPLPDLFGLYWLTLCFEYRGSTRLQNFGALALRSQAGLGLAFEVSILEAQSASARQRLWAALAAASPLEQLRLSWRRSGYWFEPSRAEGMSPAELQALASVHCEQLVVTGLLEYPFAGQLLATLQCHQVFSRQHYFSQASTVGWSELTAQAGVYILELHTPASLTVQGCVGKLPAFQEPWALVLNKPEQSVVRGLPLSNFTTGPRSFLVWCNPAMTAATLKAANRMLRL